HHRRRALRVELRRELERRLDDDHDELIERLHLTGRFDQHRGRPGQPDTGALRGARAEAPPQGGEEEAGQAALAGASPITFSRLIRHRAAKAWVSSRLTPKSS